MFKLKAGNVIQKINKMDRKQAYTWGAIIVVCFIALITLASFMGNADDTSFDGMTTRGYDLAQMPFVSDEAEAYLLASKYPDMQNNGSSLLYSQEEKEARQEEDAENAEDNEDNNESYTSSSGDNSYSAGGGYGGGYGYGGGRGGKGGKTTIGQLGQATMGHASGSGVSTTYGAPRGDFSPYKNQDKGTEIPPQLRNTDAKKALSQFAQTSRAAAGLRDGKGGNAKKALMGGNIKGSDAFTDTGVDLSKSGGLALDTNAPVTSADLSNLDKDLKDAANKAKEEKEAEKESLADRLREQLFSGMIDMAMNLMGNALNNAMDSGFDRLKGNKAFNESLRSSSDSFYNASTQSLTEEQTRMYTSTIDSNATFTKNADGTFKVNGASGTVGSNYNGGNSSPKQYYKSEGKNWYKSNQDSSGYKAALSERVAQVGSSSSGNNNLCAGKEVGTVLNDGKGGKITC